MFKEISSRTKSGKQENIIDNKIKKKGNLLFYITMATIPILQYLLFYVVVNFNSLLLAFKEYTILENGKTAFEFVGFTNFEYFFQDIFESGKLVYAFKNSLISFSVSIIVGIPLTLMFSYYIFKKCLLSGAFKFLLLLPSMISSIVLIIMFKGFVSDAIPYAMEMITGKRSVNLLAESTTLFGTVIFYNVWLSFGSGVLMYANAMSGVSKEVLEYGQVDGVTDFQEFIHIVLPSIFPTITTFLVIRVAAFFTDQANLYGFYGSFLSFEYHTLGYFLFQKVMGDTSRIASYPYAAASGLSLTLVAVPLTFLAKWALEKFGPSED